MEPLPIKPKYEDFDIPAETVQEYNLLLSEYQNHRDTNLGCLDYFAVAIVVGVVDVLNGGYSFDFKSILTLIMWSGLNAYTITFISYIVINLIIDTISKKHPITKKDKLLKRIRDLEPVINVYDKAIKDYDLAIDRYERRYPGIKDVNYNQSQYIKNREELVLNKLNRGIDYLENCAKVEWWCDLTARQFECEVAEWYRRKGYIAHTTKYVGDGGVDIVLNKGDETIFVQCKHYKAPVGVAVMRELYGVVKGENATRGILACLYQPTQGAREFAHRCGIEIVTAHTLAKYTTYAPNYDKTVRYIPEEEFIGSKKPYMYVGDIGVIFNVFDDIRDVLKYVDHLKKEGMYATEVRINNLYCVICSSTIPVESLKSFL